MPAASRPRWVRWLLRLLPAAQRRAFGDELAAVWSERLAVKRDAGGRLPYLAYCLRTVRDLLATGWRARLSAPPNGSGVSTSLPPRRYTVNTWLDETRQAARSLRRNPALTLAIVALLGVGIGGSTAIFSAVDQILLRPFAFDAERVVDVWFDIPSRNRIDWSHSNETFEFLRDSLTSVDTLARMTPGFRTLRLPDRAQRLGAAEVSADFFDLVGAPAVAGRYFSTAEDVPGVAPTVVISEGLWRREFGADPDVLGMTLDLDGTTTTVIGVFPETARLLDRLIQARAVAAGDEVELYLPIGPSAANVPPHTYVYMVLGRLAPGTGVDALRAELDAATPELLSAAATNVLVPRAEILHRRITGGARGVALLLAASAAVVLLIVCSNVAALLLVRGSRRGMEWAVRQALGGSRARLARQLVLEGAMVAVAGGAVSVAVAGWLVAGLRASAAASLPRLDALTLDVRVIGVAFVVTAGSALAFALLPAATFSRQPASGALGSRSGGLSRRGKRGLQLLVAAEVALAVALTVVTVTFARSLTHLMAQDPGYEPAGVLSMTVALPQPSYQSDAQLADFVRGTLRELESSPGVAAAALMSTPPLFAPNVSMTVESADGPINHAARETAVSPGLFDVLGMELLAGRGFRDSDDRNAAPVVVVSRALADELWPQEDPIGRTISLGSWRQFRRTSTSTPVRVREVVGVVDDFRTLGISGGDAAPYVFMPFDQAPWTGGVFMLETTIRGAAVADAARDAVRRVDPAVPVWDLEPLADSVARSSERERFGVWVIAGFALVAFVLAMTGAYCVVAYTVVLRTREIGIRSALGADARSLVRLVVASGLVPAAVGTLVGVSVTALASGFVRSLLYEVDPLDPLTLGVTSVAVFTLALVATYLPARRAARLDPLSALHRD